MRAVGQTATAVPGQRTRTSAWTSDNIHPLNKALRGKHVCGHLGPEDGVHATHSRRSKEVPY